MDTTLTEAYHRLLPRLRLTAYRYCRDREMAKDIVQDVFEKLARLDAASLASHFGTEQGNLEAWLHVSVRHRAMDIVKVDANREKIRQSVRVIFASEVANEAQAGFCTDSFRELLEILQPRQREVFRLHLDGFRNEEIAGMLGLTYNTVKNNIYEARQRMRRLWETFME